MVSRLQTGPLPEPMLDAFIATLDEIVRHHHEEDEDGYSLGPRNDVLDIICRGHDWHAGHTMINANDAFKIAVKKATKRDDAACAEMSASELWAFRREDAAADQARQREESAKSNNCFTLGVMPLQMFGQGFEIQSAVTENADKVMLLQFGDPDSHIPIHFSGDGIFQVWIEPKDLAQGRFDRIHTTLDAT